MNDAIFKFKRYEDSSLSYTGIEKHIDDEVGGFDTVIRREEYKKLFYNQQATMQATPSEAIEEVAATDGVSISTPTASVVTKTVERNEQPKQEFDCSAITVGITVTHAKFGIGKIVNIDKSRKYIRVSFSIGEKTFVMPSCFELGFLKI